jgi:hypothetical protein
VADWVRYNRAAARQGRQGELTGDQSVPCGSRSVKGADAGHAAVTMDREMDRLFWLERAEVDRKI